MIRKEDLIKKLKELKKQAKEEIKENYDDNLVVSYNNGILRAIFEIEMELNKND